jgi:hypothetical protein
MAPRINTDDFVRPATAAKMLGITRGRVVQLMLSGRLPFVEIDCYRFIPRAAVEARMKAQPGKDPAE